VFVAVSIAVNVAVSTGVFVVVSIAVDVAVFTGVFVAVSIAVNVAVSTGVFVVVSIAVDVAVFTGVFVIVSITVEVDVTVSTGVPVNVTVAVPVAVAVMAPQLVLTMFVSRVTAPFLASRLPSVVAPVSRVIDVMAIIVPAKDVDVPSVAELPTTQNTFFACAPLIRLTELLSAVINVLAVLRIKTALLSPLPFSVSVPVNPKVPESYTPGGSVDPPNSAPIEAVEVRPAASLYAVTRSFFAFCVKVSPAWSVPFNVREPSPVSVIVE
jgi:hypothetical protein